MEETKVERAAAGSLAKSARNVNSHLSHHLGSCKTFLHGGGRYDMSQEVNPWPVLSLPDGSTDSPYCWHWEDWALLTCTSASGSRYSWREGQSSTINHGWWRASISLSSLKTLGCLHLSVCCDTKQPPNLTVLKQYRLIEGQSWDSSLYLPHSRT